MAAIILAFPVANSFTGPQRVLPQHSDGNAEVIIFPGVRFERLESAPTQLPNPTRRKKTS
jgi:hypothetical protein